MTTSSRGDVPAQWKITRRVWLLLLMLFGAAFLNYVDRQLLSVLKPIIKTEFAIDDRGYATVINVFTFCYASAYMVTGWMIDRFGVRVYAGFLALWSLATLGGGLARTLPLFTGCRAVLGLAEPAHVPTTIRVGVLWFPTSRRAFLMTVAAWGGTVGAIAAPPLISWMALQWSWRAAFLIPAFAGLMLAAGWWFYYRDPMTPPDTVTPQATVPWKTLWLRRELWAIVLARLISDPVWYFCLFWMPGYFQEQRGLSLKMAGMIGWIPFLAGNLGALGSAAWSDRLVRRHGRPARARLTVLIALSCFAPVACLVPYASSLTMTLALLSVVALICVGWFAVLGPLAADLFPAGNAASVWSIAGAFGAVGAMISNYAIGRITSVVGSERMFLMLGVLHLLALAVLLIFLRKRFVQPATPFNVGV